MPYRRRIQVKRSPDLIQIETLSDKMRKGIQKWKKPLGILAGGVLLLGVAAAAYFYFSKETERKAEDLEFSAYSEYSKRTRLSGAEKEKAIRGAIEKYQQILDSFPKTKTAGLAAYTMGNAEVELKEYDKGIELYQRALASLSLSETMRGLIHLRLGYAYLAKSDPEKAISEFAQVEKNPLTRDQDFASYEIGKIYESQGKKNEALGEYESLVKSYPASPLVSEVSARISELKGISAVTAQPGSSPAAATPPPSLPSKK